MSGERRMNAVFAIVAANDTLLFEYESVARDSKMAKALGLSGAVGSDVLSHFILHAALDTVDLRAREAKEPYLRTVDQVGELFVSAYITASGMRLLLLHDIRNEDGIRGVFAAAHELLVKYMLNPFAKPNAPIASPAFEARIAALLPR